MRESSPKMNAAGWERFSAERERNGAMEGKAVLSGLGRIPPVIYLAPICLRAACAGEAILQGDTVPPIVCVSQGGSAGDPESGKENAE